ncbi:GIY-YIG nuclease family protein [Tahibacter aquaticus]|uniref:GIY-YIG nuclease family protein n=1 Tax=Tahibacter aquaticus TaxID=520092 RepID=UPI0014152258|nr:GIY-YIG nuclease family protein [Tahibacter aquaticus]
MIAEEPHPGETSGPWTKIGFSNNPPEWRLGANLKRGNSRALSVAAAFKYPTEADALAAERLAQQQFSSTCVGKEWFRVGWQDVARWFGSVGAIARTAEDIAADKLR